VETIIAAAIVTVPPTLMAALSWRNARSAKHQTNGALSEPLARIETRLVTIEDRTARIEGRLADVEVQHLVERKEDAISRLRIRTDLTNFNATQENRTDD
jgi:hypothetical protein